MPKIMEAVGLQQQGDEVPTLIREVRGLCRDVRKHDETYCATCGLRWPNDEEKPECPK